MAKYLFEARYTLEGGKGVAREGGTGRRAAVAKMAEDMGGKLESFYFGFGDVDAYVIVDLPDNTTAAAVALAVNSGGRRDREDHRAAFARRRGRGGQEDRPLSGSGALTLPFVHSKEALSRRGATTRVAPLPGRQVRLTRLPAGSRTRAGPPGNSRRRRLPSPRGSGS